MSNKMTIGTRLKEERERLGYNQSDFAALAGVTRKTLFGYESAERFPAGDALAAWSEEGLDVQYVVTGERTPTGSTQGLPADEQLLLEAYREMPAANKKKLLASLLTGEKRKASPARGVKVKVTGTGNRAAGRDYHEKE